MKKIAVVLSGCGFKDGAEITESVSTLIALSEEKCTYRIFAPDIKAPSVNHLTGEKEGDQSLLAQSARIARGEVTDIKKLQSADFDGVVFPGGFGAALNLCNFAEKGAACSVQPEVERVIQDFHKNEKPIGAFCIAPALIARVLGSHGVTVTIGNDKEIAREIEKTGAQHTPCPVTDYVTDRESKIVTSPAYMYGNAKPHEVFTGIRLAIKELVGLA